MYLLFTEINECQTNPCMNGGSCTVRDGRWKRKEVRERERERERKEWIEIRDRNK